MSYVLDELKAELIGKELAYAQEQESNARAKVKHAEDAHAQAVVVTNTWAHKLEVAKEQNLSAEDRDKLKLPNHLNGRAFRLAAHVAQAKAIFVRDHWPRLGGMLLESSADGWKAYYYANLGDERLTELTLTEAEIDYPFDTEGVPREWWLEKGDFERAKKKGGRN